MARDGFRVIAVTHGECLFEASRAFIRQSFPLTVQQSPSFKQRRT